MCLSSSFLKPFSLKGINMSSGNKEAYRGRKKIKYLDKIDILDLLDQNSNHKRVKLMYVNDETSEVDIIVDKNESSMFCLSNIENVPVIPSGSSCSDRSFVKNLRKELSAGTLSMNNPAIKMIMAMLQQQSLSEIELIKLKSLYESLPILESLCEESSANKPKKIVRKRVHKKNMGNGMRKSARLVKGHSEVNVNVVNANWINEEQLILGKNQHVSLCDSSNAAQITSCSDVSLSQKIVNTEGLPKKTPSEMILGESVEAIDLHILEGDPDDLEARSTDVDLSISTQMEDQDEMPKSSTSSLTFNKEISTPATMVDNCVSNENDNCYQSVSYTTSVSELTPNPKGNKILVSTNDGSVSEEDMRRTSVAVHVYVERQYGNVKHLEKMAYTEETFLAIVDHFEQRSEHHFLPRSTARGLMDIWCESGFVNETNVHYASAKLCKFNHCHKASSNLITPLELDLMYLSPKSNKTSKRDVNRAQKKLFDEDRGMDIEDTLPSQAISQSSPSKQELVKRNVALEKQNRLLMKKVNLYEKEKDEPNILSVGIHCKEKDCNRSYKTISGLIGHMRAFHKKGDKVDTEFTCSECGITVKNLDKHFKAMHKNRIDRACPVCKMQIVGNLKDHRGKCLKCPLCGKSFNRLDYLMDHFKNKKCKKNKSGQEAHRKKSRIGKIKSSIGQPQGSGMKFQRANDPTEGVTSCKDAEPLNIHKRDVAFGCSRNQTSNKVSTVDDLYLSDDSDVIFLGECVASQPPLESEDISTSSTVENDCDIIVLDNDSVDPLLIQGSVCKETRGIAIDNTDVYKIREMDEYNGRDSRSVGHHLSRGDCKKICLDKDFQVDSFEFTSLESINGRTQDMLEDVLGENSCERMAESTVDVFEDEGYQTEHESGDSTEFTNYRRKTKAKLNLQLRAIDDLPSKCEGDEVFLDKFKKYLDDVLNSDVEKSDFDKVQKVRTVDKYVNSIGQGLLPILHDYFEPFNSEWLLDCYTEKHTKCDGVQRQFVDIREPIYISVQVVRLFLNKYDGYAFGQKKADFLAAIHHVMKFLEYEFGSDPNKYGRDILLKVISNHALVRSFIESTGTWKRVNKDRKKSAIKSKALKEISKPNHDIKVLKKVKEYSVNDDRIEKLKKVCASADPNGRKPTAAEFRECTNIVMSEITMATGCRPVVLYRLTNEAYAGKDIGFNPHKIGKGDDQEVDEVHDGEKLMRRVNPSLPMKELACSHQIELECAICPVGCNEACPPDGFNIRVNWDKVQGSKKGPTYLHLSWYLKILMDQYDLIKRKFFENVKPANVTNVNWLEDVHTPFFLSPEGSSITRVDLSYLKKILEIDITSYSFRKILSTWALNHELEMIRQAEMVTLNHSLAVARKHYQQNDALLPQILTQTFVAEEGYLTSDVQQVVSEASKNTQSAVRDIEEKRQKNYEVSILQEKENYIQLRSELTPLSKQKKISDVDFREFVINLEKVTSINIVDDFKSRTPSAWNKFLMRSVCSATGDVGERIRSIWLSMYKGDLKNGIR